MNEKIISILDKNETEFNKYSNMLEQIRVTAINKEIDKTITKEQIKAFNDLSTELRATFYLSPIKRIRHLKPFIEDAYTLIVENKKLFIGY